jgi:hypothetical protein
LSVEKNAICSKNQFKLSDGEEIVGGEVRKNLESIVRIQFRTNAKARRLRRNLSKIKLAERGGFESPSLRHILQWNCDDDSQRDSQTLVPLSPELSQVVTAWEKLPAPLKAAILAIINSAEGRP